MNFDIGETEYQETTPFQCECKIDSELDGSQ